jgi:hypothetical protein
MAWFAWINGSALYQRLQGHRDQRWRSALDQGWEAVRRQDGAAVVRQAQAVFKAARTDAVKREALELLVRGHILEGSFGLAKEELNRLQVCYGPDAPLEAWLYFQAGELPRAIPLLEAAYRGAPAPELGELLARALIGTGRFQEALQLCADPGLSDRATVLYPMLQAYSFHAREYDISAEAGRRGFELEGDPALAFNVACAYARAARVGEALEWVSRAVDAGFGEHEALTTDPDLESLRGRPEFELICRSLTEAKADGARSGAIE